jgi:hypothetical protein
MFNTTAARTIDALVLAMAGAAAYADPCGMVGTLKTMQQKM